MRRIITQMIKHPFHTATNFLCAFVTLFIVSALWFPTQNSIKWNGKAPFGTVTTGWGANVMWAATDICLLLAALFLLGGLAALLFRRWHHVSPG
jgi:uncharacterized membrane protein YhaH (DUF805 family)